MQPTTVAVSVHILDKEYQVACQEDEREGLISAAELINRKMREVRDRGNVIGTDRIAVVTALNVAHELLQLKSAQAQVDNRLSEMESTLAHALQQESLF